MVVFKLMMAAALGLSVPLAVTVWTYIA